MVNLKLILPVLTFYPSPGLSVSWCSCSASGWCCPSAWTWSRRWSSAGCRALCPAGPGPGPSSASSTGAGTGERDSRRADSSSASPRVWRCPLAETALGTWWSLLRFKFTFMTFSENKSWRGSISFWTRSHWILGIPKKGYLSWLEHIKECDAQSITCQERFKDQKLIFIVTSIEKLFIWHTCMSGKEICCILYNSLLCMYIPPDWPLSGVYTLSQSCLTLVFTMRSADHLRR